MFEAKAKAGLVVLEAKAKILRGQGQGQWSLRLTKKDMFKAQVYILLPLDVNIFS